MENGSISVDRWVQGSQVYFLTHLHSDHTQGLSSSWSHGPLFCSSITAKLFPFKFPGFDLSLLRILQIGTSHTLSLRSTSSSVVHVIAIDACHCPGSIMLLFRGEFGCVLYTGDFRWEATCEKAKIARHALRAAIDDDDDDDGVDVVYLDNTYSNPTYDFPTRSVAAQQIIDIIASHPDHDVIIAINTLGKEDLLLQISQVLNIKWYVDHLGRKIWVWPERLQTMHLLGLPDIFTTDTTLTRVRAVPQYSFSIETLEALNTIHRPTIGIMPSGIPWVKKSHQKGQLSFLTSRYKNGKMSEVQSDKPVGNIGLPEKYHQYIFSVPYSDHSNYAELESFIKLVKPANMKGIVSSSSCYIEPMYFFGRHCCGNQPIERSHDKFTMKESVKRVGEVSLKTSVGDDDVVDLDRNIGKALKRKFLNVRMNELSTIRRKRRGAKISDDNGLDHDS